MHMNRAQQRKLARHVITNQPDLSPLKKLILLTLRDFDNETHHDGSPTGDRGAYLSNGRLAFELGVSEGAIRNAMAELIRDRFVVHNGRNGYRIYRRVVCPYRVLPSAQWRELIYTSEDGKERPRTLEEVQAMQRAVAGIRPASAPHNTSPPEQATRSAIEQVACSTVEQQIKRVYGGNSEFRAQSAPGNTLGESEREIPAVTVGANLGSCRSGSPGTGLDAAALGAEATVTLEEPIRNLIGASSVTSGSGGAVAAHCQVSGICTAEDGFFHVSSDCCVDTGATAEFSKLPFAVNLLDRLCIRSIDAHTAETFLAWWKQAGVDIQTFGYVVAGLDDLPRGGTREEYEARHPGGICDLIARFEPISAFLAQHAVASVLADLECLSSALGHTYFVGCECGYLVQRFKHTAQALSLEKIGSVDQYLERYGSDEALWMAACLLAANASTPTSSIVQVQNAVLRACVCERDSEKLIDIIEKLVKSRVEAFGGFSRATVHEVRRHCEHEVTQARTTLSGKLSLSTAIRAGKQADQSDLTRFIEREVACFLVERKLRPLGLEAAVTECAAS